jgi:hypothetical protein
MQRDFHFDALYCLCRCAGFSPGESRTVAAASQFTDDCSAVEIVRRPGGAPEPSVQTYPGGLSVLDAAVQGSVLRPFHFPAAEGDGGVVLPGNPAAAGRAERAAALASTAAPYGLHALGIALHALVDTFAHQGFSASWSPLNATADLELVPRDPVLLDRVRGFFLSRFPDFPVRLGHAQAGYCPDVPFLKWSYRFPGESAWTRARWAGVRFRRGRVFRDNAAIAAAAASGVAALLGRVKGRRAARDAEEQAAFFTAERFRSMDSLNRRSEQWRALFFSDPFFGFREPEDLRCFAYEGKEWLGRAIRPSPRSSGAAVRVLRRGFTKTDWWRFQQAARWYRALPAEAGAKRASR